MNVRLSQTLTKHEAWVRDNADHFTAVTFHGRGSFDKRQYLSLAEARERAPKDMTPTGGRPIGIYAVKGVYEVHVENIQP